MRIGIKWIRITILSWTLELEEEEIRILIKSEGGTFLSIQNNVILSSHAARKVLFPLRERAHHVHCTDLGWEAENGQEVREEKLFYNLFLFNVSSFLSYNELLN